MYRYKLRIDSIRGKDKRRKRDMEWLWLIYWGLLLLIMIFGVMVVNKKNKRTGILQVLLAIILPIWAFIFALKRDYTSSGSEANEIYFMYIKIMEGNIEAILITLFYILLIIMFIYNISLFKKQ